MPDPTVSPPRAPSRLLLRLMKTTRTVPLDSQFVPREFQLQILETIATLSFEQWRWEPEMQEYYVLPAQGAAPCAKQVTLALSSLDYLRMERLLKLRVPAELPLPTRERPITSWQAPLKAGLFAATLLAADLPPLELLTHARYVRVMATPVPILWNGQVQLTFEFPVPYCETTPRRGIPKLVELRAGQ